MRTTGEFEFLSSLPFGPYLPNDSPLHRLDPRTRILLVVGFLAAFIIANHPAGLVIGLAVALAAWRWARISFAMFWRGWRAALPFLLLLALLQILLRTGEKNELILLSLPWVVITLTDVWYGLALLLRFTGFMAVLGLATMVLSESELTSGLESLLSPLNLLHFPSQDFVMVVRVTLRYFPLLSQTAERIAKAQAARGADWQPTGLNFIRRARQIIPLIVPLFVASLHRAETMALAMDARGYGVYPIRTSLVILRYRRADAVVLTLAAVLMLVTAFL